MPYITSNFSVGQVVYHYDTETDAVWRGTVKAIHAVCREAGYGGSFAISYLVDFADGPCDHSEDELHKSAETAFYSAPDVYAADSAPIPVPEVTILPAPEVAAADEPF